MAGRDTWVWLFIALTVLTTAPFWALGIATGNSAGGRGAYAVGSMWGPGMAALLTGRLTTWGRRPWLGIRLAGMLRTP